MELIKGGWYMTVREAMQKWHFATRRSVDTRLKQGRIEGAFKFNGQWMIPSSALFDDLRIKDGKYIGWRKRYGKGKDRSGDHADD
jgi:hypothetical protein